ncbi:MAG: 50S ribosomal protein L21 [Flavobacteriales bacterium]|nr:MAG: 50S ribosomal protein L21 [Flavobacteriales bacterium]
MYAVVEITGHQYKVEKDQQIFVNRLEGKEGDKVEFSNVLLVENNGKVAVGAPVIDGAKVTAKILEHVKGDKVIVFKKKRRKGYQVRNGHRQLLSQIQIEKIEEKGAKKVAAKKEDSPVKVEAKVEKPKTEKKAEVKAEAPKKKAAPKKETAKKKEEKKAENKEENSEE